MDKYTIAQGESLVALIASVNVLVESGYSPVGRVSHIEDVYLQGMFKHPAGADRIMVSSPRVRFHSSACPCFLVEDE